MEKIISRQINSRSSKEDKFNTADAVFSTFAELFFDRLIFLSNPGGANSTATSGSSYRTLLRVSDTSKGKNIRPDKELRFRTIFYVSGGVENADFYILSPATYRSESITSDIGNFDTFDAFAGIRVVNGQVYLSSKSRGIQEQVNTSVNLKGTTTYLLDIIFNVTSLEVYIDSGYVGSISCDLKENINNLITVFPIFAPIKSTTGVSVNLNFENYQLIQDK